MFINNILKGETRNNHSKGTEEIQRKITCDLCVCVCVRATIMIVKMDPDELITFRVQYLVDTDPLDCTSMYPIPTRAPTYAFAATLPLATQLGTILRLLNAPQRVRF